MAVGKQIGDFSSKVTSVTYGAQSTQVNTDGTATGYGRVQATFTFEGDPVATSGTCSGIVAAYLDDGSIVGGNIQGKWEEAGKHTWRGRGINTATDGNTMAIEGELGLDSFNGTLYEWS